LHPLTGTGQLQTFNISSMIKILVPTLLSLSCACVSAQDRAEYFFEQMRPSCTKLVQQELTKNISTFSTVPVNVESVCNCATERFRGNQVFKRITSLSDKALGEVPNFDKIILYMTGKYVGASLACFADALNASADHIDLTP